MGSIKALTKDRIIAALYKSCGIVSEAAHDLGVSRSRLSDRVHGDKVLLNELQGARQDILDKLRSKLFKQAMKGDSRLLMFALERLDPEFRQPQLQNNVVVNNIQRPDERAIERAKAIFEEMRKGEEQA